MYIYSSSCTEIQSHSFGMKCVIKLYVRQDVYMLLKLLSRTNTVSSSFCEKVCCCFSAWIWISLKISASAQQNFILIKTKNKSEDSQFSPLTNIGAIIDGGTMWGAAGVGGWRMGADQRTEDRAGRWVEDGRRMGRGRSLTWSWSAVKLVRALLEGLGWLTSCSVGTAPSMLTLLPEILIQTQTEKIYVKKHLFSEHEPFRLFWVLFFRSGLLFWSLK